MKDVIKETESVVPANNMGASSSSNPNSPLATFDPLLGDNKVLKRKQFRDIIKDIGKIKKTENK